MPVSPDCILCLCRQSLDAARFASSDPRLHEQVLRRSLELALERGFADIPPLLGQEIHREIRRITGNADPYLAVKRQFNDVMFSRIEELRAMIRRFANPLEGAVRLAIAGNTIDFALGTSLTTEIVDAAIQKAMHQPINGDLEALFRAVSEAKNVLYIADNSGEIVCDRLLVEEILREFSPRLTVAVRGVPVINDATREDAERIGLTTLVPVIDNGNDGLGTILEQCSDEFLKAFREADLVIAKGLANFETLIEYGPDRITQNVAYLFKAKCPFIARFSGTELGDLVVRIENSAARSGLGR